MGQNVVWVAFSSRLYRVAPEHIRLLSKREAAASLDSLAQGDMPFPPKDQGEGVFRFEDLTHQQALDIPMPNESPEEVPMPSIVNPNHQNANPGSQDGQLDSEPGQNAEPDNASGYSPTPPIATPPVSEHQFSHNPTNQPENNPEELPNIPVPDSSDEGLMTEDYWIQQGFQLLRVHRCAPSSTFDPTSVEDCPVDVLTISSDRTTSGYCSKDQQMWNKTDQWGDDEDSWETPDTWTGITMFHIVPNACKQQSAGEDVMHISHDQCMECEVYLTSTDIHEMEKHPDEFFNLMATASKRQRVEVKIKDLSPKENQEFKEAKYKEVDQWIATETVRKVLKDKISEENNLFSDGF